uniref:RING-type E3 ubiquitin transferase n=1 Tax=Esox lucius TaxID=8010 RepID=A0A6Q2WUS4_ESOLU
MATTTAAASSGGPGTVGSVNHLASVPRHPHPGPSESMKVAVLRSGHTTERIEAHEEISFAYQRSREKECNVCLEVVLDKDIPKERRFGILTKCRHCYCLRCIRSWRASRYNETAKLCPVCRTRSPFFVPSDYWVDDIYEKRKLIKKYKAGMVVSNLAYLTNVSSPTLYVEYYTGPDGAQRKVLQTQPSSVCVVWLETFPN